MNNIFSSLVSITQGLHRDRRSEREYQNLLPDIKLNPIAANGTFEINFKKPLSSKKEYYRKLIFNQTENEILSFISEFPQNALLHENKYAFTTLSNKFDKYLNDIAAYIHKRPLTGDVNSDYNYILNYLKVSAIRLYVELQEQYGQYSEHSLFTIPEIAEKYFNDSEFNTELITKIEASKIEIVKKTQKPKIRPKTKFSFKSNDTSTLLAVLKKLHLKIELLDNRTKVEELHNLLIAEDFTKFDSLIYLQCETTQFSYVVKELKSYFHNLKPASIEYSGKFITKTGTPLKANNLYKNTVHNPKEKEEIDKIIQQLQ